MIYITRVENFNAAHKLWNENWSAEKNKEVFGKCSNANFHGHNYDLHVTVKGEVNQDTGFVVNAKELGDLIKTKVIDEIDHCNLNLDVQFMKGKFTSVENLAIGIWEQLEADIVKMGGILHCIKLIETRRIYVEYYGK